MSKQFPTSEVRFAFDREALTAAGSPHRKIVDVNDTQLISLQWRLHTAVGTATAINFYRTVKSLNNTTEKIADPTQGWWSPVDVDYIFSTLPTGAIARSIPLVISAFGDHHLLIEVVASVDIDEFSLIYNKSSN